MADQVTRKRDPRQSTKNAVCVGLAIVLIAVVIRMFGNTPSGASASAIPEAGASSPAAGDSAGSAAPALRPLVIEIPDALPRDLFDVNAAFPPETPAKPVPTTMPTVKASTVAEDHAAIAAEARATIVLDATMLGSDPTALINGRQCRVGNVVKGFTVTRIAADHVVIERGGVKLRVSYAKPGNGHE